MLVVIMMMMFKSTGFDSCYRQRRQRGAQGLLRHLEVCRGGRHAHLWRDQVAQLPGQVPGQPQQEGVQDCRGHRQEGRVDKFCSRSEKFLQVELSIVDMEIEADGSTCPYDNLKAYDTPAGGSPTLIAVSFYLSVI